MPPGLDAFRAMALGTAGFTAALAIHRMEHNGQTPGSGPVVVTGATGGVGSIAIDMLAARGYEVDRGHRQAGADRLSARRWAPTRCCARRKSQLGIEPLEAARLAGAIDNVGGEMLAWLTRHDGFLGQHRQHRAGRRRRAQDHRDALHPARREPARHQFLRDAASERLEVWQRIATDLAPRHLERIVTARSRSRNCRGVPGLSRGQSHRPHGGEDRLRQP